MIVLVLAVEVQVDLHMLLEGLLVGEPASAQVTLHPSSHCYSIGLAVSAAVVRAQVTERSEGLRTNVALVLRLSSFAACNKSVKNENRFQSEKPTASSFRAKVLLLC